jgi:SOS response regulatory protein OraA/RecX
VPEFKILANIIDFMEANGVTAKLVAFAVDQQLADEINSKYGTSYSVIDLEKAVDKCIANEWIDHRAFGEKYKSLGITTKGVGVVRSKARAEEIKASRSWLKKASDYIEDHKGLFVVLGFLVALATLASKYFGSH